MQWLLVIGSNRYRIRAMNLSQYLASPGSLSVAELRKQIGAKSDAQVRQWQHGYSNRKPGPIYCHRIELATGGVVNRASLRPDDWADIWPELVSTPATTCEPGHG